MQKGCRRCAVTGIRQACKGTIFDSLGGQISDRAANVSHNI